MTSLTYQKTVSASYLLGIAGLIIMPDLIFGLLLDLTHNLRELVHLLFESIESTLDHIVEHLFHTDLHETQIIVFYVMLSMAFDGLYYLWRIMPGLYRNLKENVRATYLQRKTRACLYWAEQSLINKIKLIAMLNAVLICFVLFGC
ncbi:MAG: hypothetical protein PHY16_18440 [Methylobacter sp.]|nr:hypothetical protein [Methylobacter sp.]